MENLVKDYISSNHNYRYDSNPLIVEKVFNRGMGSLDLLRFYPDRKTICINKTLFNRVDRRRLDEFCRDAHIEDWLWVKVDYGYPEYYFHKLRLPA